MATMKEIAAHTLCCEDTLFFMEEANNQQYALLRQYLYGTMRSLDSMSAMTPEQACYFILIMAAAEGIE